MYDFRPDNPNALITPEDGATVIHGILPSSEIKFKIISSIIDFLGFSNYWLLRVSSHKHAIIDVAKFVEHDTAIEGVG